MLHWLDESEGNLICFAVSGKVTDVDYREILPKVTTVLSQSSSLRVFADFTHFEGWEWAHSMDKFPFAVEDLKKLAILGHNNGRDIADLAKAKLLCSEVQYFAVDEKAAALTWVKN